MFVVKIGASVKTKIRMDSIFYNAIVVLFCIFFWLYIAFFWITGMLFLFLYMY